jgi:hypothetical protein
MNVREEQIVKSGPANLMRGVEAVGGKVTLTTEALAFEAHAFNVQREPLVIPNVWIARVDLIRTKVFGVATLPTSIEVHTKDGKSFSFVVKGREQWKAAIEGRIT